MSGTSVTAIAPGVYRVEHDGGTDIVYVAGPPGNRWAFWNGHLFRDTSGESRSTLPPAARLSAAQLLAAPIPSTVVDVLVEPGATVKKGDTVVLLEGMKMELPIRAPRDAVVRAVHCRPGELVRAGAVLVDLE